MGIRSDVYFLCQEPVYKAFKTEVLDKWTCMRPDSVKILKSTYPHLPDCYLLTWEFIKWYDDFVDIHEANKFIESRANGEDYHLVNIGEGFKFIIITEKEDSKSITAYAEGLPDCEFYTEMKIHLPEGEWATVSGGRNE